MINDVKKNKMTAASIGVGVVGLVLIVGAMTSFASDPDRMRLEGLNQAKKGEYVQAEKTLKNALAKDESPATLVALGDINLDQGKEKEAREYS